MTFYSHCMICIFFMLSQVQSGYIIAIYRSSMIQITTPMLSQKSSLCWIPREADVYTLVFMHLRWVCSGGQIHCLRLYYGIVQKDRASPEGGSISSTDCEMANGRQSSQFKRQPNSMWLSMFGGGLTSKNTCPDTRKDNEYFVPKDRLVWVWKRCFFSDWFTCFYVVKERYKINIAI